ncbi:MAG: GMC family oxidoreductase [Anaerolineae bacterium]|nr:GMC family oxidoreductase [Anaerolineae bacterium]
MTVYPKVDIVTVGAGWTAGIIAQQLTAEGYRVVSIEAGGDRFANPDFAHNHDTLYHMLRTGLMYNLSKETWTWRPNPRAPALPIRQYGSFHPGVGIGGAGVHWAAQTWRFYPTDFRYRSHHVERYGEERIPQDCTVQDWGITYEELEPFYSQADYEIGLSGQTGNLNGAILAGGNPFEGARSRPYPLPPLLRSIPAGMFSDAARNLGYHPFPQPASILSRAYRDLSGRERAACVYCGFCTRYGCEVDAKASANVSHIPLALDTGLYEIRKYSKVINVNVNQDGMATGVTYVDLRTGERHEQPAEVIILSGFTLTNVRLLLLSRSEAHPDGIGNDQGMVGKNYTYQLSKNPASGMFVGREFNLYMGNSCLQDIVEDFNADNFDHSDLDFIGGASITCGGGEREPITSAHNMMVIPDPAAPAEEEEEPERRHLPIASEFGSLIGPSTQWGREWKENLRTNWNSTVSIGIQGESLPYTDQFLDLDPTYKDSLGLPLLRISFDFHDNDYRLYRYMAARSAEIMRAMNPTHIDTTDELSPYNIYSYQSTHNTGGAIMGTDPGNSVTNKYGQVWDTPNVFVTGAALFPQNAGLNPTGTVIALAYMAAAALKKTYFRNPGEVMS